jgi:hypothetical protein
MDDQESLLPVRFRAIVEMSFPDADRLDPIDGYQLMEQWRKAIEDSPIFNCKDVVIREFLTIGDPHDDNYRKDYEKWRHQDLSHVRPGIRITGRRQSFLRSEMLAHDATAIINAFAARRIVTLMTSLRALP